MCELLGLSFAVPISADFSLREFEQRDEENPDGWGLGWYPDRSLAIVKEPIEWGESTYSGFLETYSRLRSRIYLAHVRRKTTGGVPTHADTHPFGRELAGREYCFAHNGTLAGPFWELPEGRFKPIGHTDSESLFCHLLDEIALVENQLQIRDSWGWLHARLQSYNRWGRLNCLLADGQRLFCYHDASGWKGLALRKLYMPDSETRSFGDPQVKIDLASAAANHGFAVATCPLSATGWQSFAPGEMIVLEDGELRFTSRELDASTMSNGRKAAAASHSSATRHVAADVAEVASRSNRQMN